MANFAIRVLLLKRESSYRIFLSGKFMALRGIMLGRGVPEEECTTHTHTHHVYED